MGKVELLRKSGKYCLAMITNNGGMVAVIKNAKLLVVISDKKLANGAAVISLVKQAEPNTYDDFYHVVGKLALKPDGSKYFGNPIFEEHLINGRVTSRDYPELEYLSTLFGATGLEVLASKGVPENLESFLFEDGVEVISNE